jgi:peptidoglycan-associated lipoprotein
MRLAIGPAIGRVVTSSVLLWIAIFAVAAGLGCASDTEEEEGGAGRGGALVGEEVGGSDFERYGAARGTPLSAEERAALGLKNVYFDYDQFSLDDTARETLRRDAAILQERPEILVEIQGNCDERGSEEYNLALGERRARAAKDYLVDSGIPRERLSTVSFGESNPAATGGGEQAWQLNRRDDFLPMR